MSTPPTLETLLDRYFSGGSHLSNGELARLLKLAASAAKTRTRHESVVTAAASKATTGKDPTALDIGAVLTLQFTPNTDEAFRTFKIPYNYVGDAAFHIHWTKSGDVDESTKAARWRISYKLFTSTEAAAGDANTSATVIEVEDTYDDAGTTTRLVYRTPDLPLVGVTPGSYLGLKIEAITPVGTAMATEPALFSVDMTYTEEINR